MLSRVPGTGDALLSDSGKSWEGITLFGGFTRLGRSICSGPFLDEEFKTVRYDNDLTAHDDGSWSYNENTQLQIKA